MWTQIRAETVSPVLRRSDAGSLGRIDQKGFQDRECLGGQVGSDDRLRRREIPRVLLGGGHYRTQRRSSPWSMDHYGDHEARTDLLRLAPGAEIHELGEDGRRIDRRHHDAECGCEGVSRLRAQQPTGRGSDGHHHEDDDSVTEANSLHAPA